MSDIYVMQNANGETNSPIQVEFDPIRWALLNPWLSEGQTISRCSKVVASEARLTHSMSINENSLTVEPLGDTR